MLRVFVTALAVSIGALSAPAATADEFTDAVDAYLKEDYSGIDVIARHADDGVPEAIGLLGRAYVNGNGLEVDMPLGLALLEQAATLGEISSAIQLGRAYEFGLEGLEPDPAIAAKWYVLAAKAGESASAPAALKRLPPDIVIEAGGATWAGPVETGDVLPVEGPATPTPTANAQTPLASKLPAETSSPASAILGTDQAPAPLSMLDNTSFPVFADTKFSPVADAAASCLVVLRPEIRRREAELENLMGLDKIQSSQESGVGYDKLLENRRELEAMQSAFAAGERVLSDPKQNGGLNADAIRMALSPHQDAAVARPETGPSPAFCGRKLTQLIGESAGWRQN